MKVFKIGLLIVIFGSCCEKHSAPEHLTATKILKIEIGMSREEVIDILNKPIAKLETDFDGDETYQYTVGYKCNFPVLWVHFDSIGVKEVYAKYYAEIDDYGIYGLSRNQKTQNVYQWGIHNLYKHFKK